MMIMCIFIDMDQYCLFENIKKTENLDQTAVQRIHEGANTRSQKCVPKIYSSCMTYCRP